MKQLPPAFEPFLGPLKDFQRETVDYVFQRMYLDDPPARRFLVADEVGLGKTLVARGIIARALHHLFDEGIQRVDVIYVCSNAAIARQNLNRLNITGEPDLPFASRLTLLPSQVKDLQRKRINLVSFTPGTTFDLKSRGGKMQERADIYFMLKDALDLPKNGLINLLQCTASYRGWRKHLKDRLQRVELDPGLTEKFARLVRKDRSLVRRLTHGCERFHRFRKNVLPEDNQLRYDLIGELRRKLADMCIDALEPDLVILDEFQRFRDLLERDEQKQTEAAQLAQTLMRYPGSRVLLLSATPYRMLTLGAEGEDHYEDFLHTVDFLLQDDRALDELREDFRRFRNLLVAPDGIPATRITQTRDRIQSTLLSVMTRTERVETTLERNAMVKDVPRHTPLERRDLKQARLLDTIAREVETYDTIEYWKSAPYLLNLMKKYQIKEKFVDRLMRPPEAVVEALHDFREQHLRHRDVERYREIDPQNGRLRALIQDSLGEGLGRLLWIPPSLPYWAPAGAFADVGESTKALVFSSWNFVPDVIAAFVSYTAERLALDGEASFRYGELVRKRRPLLLFKVTSEGPANMTTLNVLYPSATLAREVDPLGIALDLVDDGALTLDRVREEARRILTVRLKDTGLWPTETSPLPDPRWYWAAPLLLDRRHAPEMERWVGRSWIDAVSGEGEEDTGFADHVRLFDRTFSMDEPLGATPEDLVDVLVDMALGSPAICALRSLFRIVASDEWTAPWLLTSAVRIAWGFRSLFNHPESILLLRAGEEDTPYWRTVLDYGVAGNLPSLLDEYVHVLRESLGLIHRPDEQVAEEVATAAAEALSIRTSTLKVDEYRANRRNGTIEANRFSMRCRFALRFGELQDDEGQTLARIGTVREAFNSPFRPFILASTSIGQEGLDFHTYCHAVYHWNLPSNPVDLEQREGRVHRYKGHAIRKNVSRRFGLEGLGDRLGAGKDPWEVLFEMARENRPDGANDLWPFWIYEIDNGARVERRVPMLPFSRESGRLERLKASLAVYRLAFGQPRQEDLVEWLRRLGETHAGLIDLDQFRVSLAPPRVEVEQAPSAELLAYLERRGQEREVEESGDVGGREDLLAALSERCSPEGVEAVRRLLLFSEPRGRFYWGRSKNPSVTAWLRIGEIEAPVWSCYTGPPSPRVAINFDWMLNRGVDESVLRRMANRLRRISRTSKKLEELEEAGFQKRPGFSVNGVLAREGAADVLFHSVEAIILDR